MSVVNESARHCPLCGGENQCQLATHGTYKGLCWCMSSGQPQGVELPVEWRGRPCLCERCFRAVAETQVVAARADELRAGRDFYTENGVARAVDGVSQGQ